MNLSAFLWLIFPFPTGTNAYAWFASDLTQWVNSFKMLESVTTANSQIRSVFNSQLSYCSKIKYCKTLCGPAVGGARCKQCWRSIDACCAYERLCRPETRARNREWILGSKESASGKRFCMARYIRKHLTNRQERKSTKAKNRGWRKKKRFLLYE